MRALERAGAIVLFLVAAACGSGSTTTTPTDTVATPTPYESTLVYDPASTVADPFYYAGAYPVDPTFYAPLSVEPDVAAAVVPQGPIDPLPTVKTTLQSLTTALDQALALLHALGSQSTSGGTDRTIGPMDFPPNAPTATFQLRARQLSSGRWAWANACPAEVTLLAPASASDDTGPTENAPFQPPTLPIDLPLTLPGE